MAGQEGQKQFLRCTVRKPTGGRGPGCQKPCPVRGPGTAVAMGETKVQPRKIHLPGGPLLGCGQGGTQNRGDSVSFHCGWPLAAHFTGSCSGEQALHPRSPLCALSPRAPGSRGRQGRRTIPCWAGIASHSLTPGTQLPPSHFPLRSILGLSQLTNRTPKSLGLLWDSGCHTTSLAPFLGLAGEE